jgi:outer membrane protein assembly factor BamB
MNNKLLLASAFLLIVFTNSIYAQDWPQFLGPNRNSTSPQQNLLRSWPDSGPEIVWSVPVGIGYGGPVIKDGQVYLLDRDDNVGDKLRCFDLATGKELWNFAYSAPGAVMFPGSRSVPAIDGNLVYSCGPYGDLYCIDVNTHQPVWNKNVWKDFGGKEIPIWAISQCPLVYGNLLIIASQAPEAGVLAYNKTTGNIVWKTANLGNETYVSPTLAKIAGDDQVVMVTSSTNPFKSQGAKKTLGKIIGLEPLSGKVLWEYTNWECHISVAPALDAGENRLLVVGGYELGCTMIQIEKNTDKTYSVTELFKHNEFGDQTKPPVQFNGYFYAQFGTNNKRDGLVCMNKEGKVLWRTKNTPAFNKGSMIVADGLILATDGFNKLYLIEPDTTAFKPLASVEILKQGGVNNSNGMTNFGGPTQNWAPIALADGKLLIRDQSRLICVKVVGEN